MKDPKPQSAPIAQKRLEELGRKMLSEIEQGSSPEFQTLLRSKGNVFFDEAIGCLRLGDKVESRTFVNVAQAKKFMQTVAVAAKCKKFLEEGAHTSIRGLFYQLKYSLGEEMDEELFEEQEESVHPEEPLLVRLDGRMRLMSGAELVDEGLRTGQIIREQPSTVMRGLSARAPSFNGAQEVMEHPVTALIRNLRPREMLRIETESGRQVRVTPFHSVFVPTPEGGIAPRKAEKLRKGDWIAVPRRISVRVDHSPVNVLEGLFRLPDSLLKRIHLYGEKKVIRKLVDRIRSRNERILMDRGKESSYRWCWKGAVPLDAVRASGANVSDLLQDLRVGMMGGRERYRLTIEKNEALGTVLGYLASKGAHMIVQKRGTTRKVILTNSSEAIRREFSGAFRKAFGAECASRRPPSSKGASNQNIGHDLFSLLLETSFAYPAGCRSWEKRVPDMLLDAPEECLRGFLRAFRLGDGAFENEGNHCAIKFFTSSRELANGLSILLLRAGIFPRICSVQVKNRRHHEKYIVYVDSREYIRRLAAITGDRVPKGKNLPTHDYIPHARDLVAEFMNSLVLPEEIFKRVNFYQAGELSRNTLLKILRLLEPLAPKDSPFLARLHEIVSSDIYWDRVKKVQYDEVAPYTVDLSVSDGSQPIENFIGGFGGVCLHNSNPLIEDLEVALKVKREDLNLNTDRKGVVAGNMVLLDKFGGERIEIDCSKQGRSGWMIPSDVDNGMDFISVDADWVLVVEKDALWQRLNEDKFWKKENCILITPKGQASRGCRRLIRKLANRKLPIIVFTDNDAWGWYIYWTIKTGSMNLAYLANDISTPEARFIGMSMQDLKDYEFLNRLTIRAKDVDVKRAEEMLSYPWVSRHKAWAEELKAVLKTRRKIEQDALQGPRLSFVGEYLREKMAKKKFLP